MQHYHSSARITPITVGRITWKLCSWWTSGRPVTKAQPG